MSDEEQGAPSEPESPVPDGQSDIHGLVGGNGHRPPKKADPRLLDPHGILGAPNVFPGFNGVPFRGPVPDLKENDPEHKQPQVGVQAHVEVLVTNKPEDMARYEEIMQTIGNGFGQLGAEERQYDDSIKGWRIFVRWWALYSYVPKGRANG
jgi:hypothetical protein